ncbi:MAG: putative porin [Pseudomonadales bacterium]|nr:putative porin [Pseudomonadales bacterium]
MNKMSRTAFAVALAGSTAAVSAADVSQAELDQLKAQVASMDERMNAMDAPSLEDKFKVKGDFRYRYETIDAEGKDRRSRHRIRARIAGVIQLPTNVEIGMGLATGGDDPVSSNQTLGKGGSSKGVQLDKAYAKWKATDSLYVQAGKYSNPLFRPAKSGLLWDGDWRPEGISAGWKNSNLFATAMVNLLESDDKGDKDVLAWSLQGGTKIKMGAAKLTMALGYHSIPTKGMAPSFDPTDSFGNSTDAGGNYLYDYEMAEVGAVLGMKVSSLPLNLYVNYVQNMDADNYDQGYIVGAKLGKAKGKGTWALGYQYEDLQADAVLGALSDSDFAGGGTDGKGHKFSGAVGINKQWSVAATWFYDNEAGGDLGTATDYNRLQLDTKFKF